MTDKLLGPFATRTMYCNSAKQPTIYESDDTDARMEIRESLDFGRVGEELGNFSEEYACATISFEASTARFMRGLV